MKSILAVTVALVAVLASKTSAATIISIAPVAGEATPGLAGYRTYTLTATSDAGKIIGFNFDRTGGSGLGFYGDFGQSNPFGATTVFNDTPEAQYAAAGNHIKADTHFLVKGADGIAVNASESPTYIGAAWNIANTGNATSSLVFAQVVLREGSVAPYAGDFTVETASGIVILERVGTPLPEPSTATLFAIAALASTAAIRRRRC